MNKSGVSRCALIKAVGVGGESGGGSDCKQRSAATGWYLTRLFFHVGFAGECGRMLVNAG